MVEVAGPSDPILVHRTTDDVADAANGLLDPVQSGESFAEQLTVFFQELRPTGAEIRHNLAKKLKEADLHKISQFLPLLELRLKNTVCRHGDNNPYTNRIRTLGDKIKKFPHRMDMSVPSSIKQQPDELVDDWRLGRMFQQTFLNLLLSVISNYP
ncbi:hypothetical protein ATANTOWER_027785 [Ataeniobius toweri]|uniref:Uncharacterized protein n=1 Tax=Ataeniobius toweri TaxID=208326 RepID=A0ABU7C9M2_9TELE|nr:hypothetical protein [Ataeniobius toweri]